MCLLRAFSRCISSCRPEGCVSGWQWFRRQVYGNSTHIKNPIEVEGRLCFSTHVGFFNVNTWSNIQVLIAPVSLCLSVARCFLSAPGFTLGLLWMTQCISTHVGVSLHLFLCIYEWGMSTELVSHDAIPWHVVNCHVLHVLEQLESTWMQTSYMPSYF